MQVWNTRFKKQTPEYIFHCQSPVLSCCFARFHPNLILGGTYSGKIVLWDNRSPKRTPVQRSSLSASAHTVRSSPLVFQDPVAAALEGPGLADWDSAFCRVPFPAAPSAELF